ncbi:MAG: TIGR04283 family arsenosugar biosynthesis glycosyltransferase [Spirochaetota bacterium]
MKPELSIVVPLYHEAFEVTDCLSWLARCRGIGACEVILVEGDDGASLPPLEHAARMGLAVRTVRSRAGRGRQLNAGGGIARSERLLFLHVDTRLPIGFVPSVTRALDRHEAGAFDLRIDSPHPFVRLVSLVGRLRSRITRVPYGDQAHFIRAATFRSVGGYPDTPIMEDVGLMDRLREHRIPIVILSPPARTSSRRWVREGAVRTTLRNWRLMLAYRSGRSPHGLRNRYRPQSELERVSSELLVFHRALRPGGVKNRLAADLAVALRSSDDTAARAALELYRAMLDDLIPETRLRGVETRYLIDEPGTGTDLPARRLASLDRSLPQQGENLWERMSDAFARAFAGGAERCVLIGSDVPGVRRQLLREAFARLATHPVVVGPSADGGFYLLGARPGVALDELLAHARSREAPATGILEWCAGRGLAVATIATLRDVDHLADLASVLAGRDARARRLAGVARRLGL